MTDTVVNLPAPAPARREIQNVVDAVPILDTARFEHMQRVARVMASSSMIPETLRTVGKGNDKVDLPFEQVLSNCFLVVNQAARWGMDPFAVISCCAVVHGRLAYEGKLVAAVLAAKMNISLHHYFTGEPSSDGYRIYLCDQPFTEQLIGQLKPGAKILGVRLWDGSVGEWKTTGAGTPWTPKNYPRMLIYRGSRDWTRIYEPALMLGVYSDDEMLDLVEDARARRATPVAGGSLMDRLAAAKLPGGTADGFSQEHVARETNGAAQESQDIKGDAGHSVTSHDATRHGKQVDTQAGATDAPRHPDRTETVGEAEHGGGHEVTAAGAAPDDTSAPRDYNSSGAPQGQTDTPAAADPHGAAGTQSELPAEGSATVGDGEARDGVTGGGAVS
ncbi:MAG: hypothetical protein Q7T73_02700, partial [Beijerinckiaceae bacterium]|nr:hypothetical protein [Beijerinckiaceae bacterium]